MSHSKVALERWNVLSANEVYLASTFREKSDENISTCALIFHFSAFARYPNGVVVHYYCCKDPKVCPVD